MAHEILLIESADSDRKDIGTFLESVGFKLHYATNSKDGLKDFRDISPDLVIVEVLISGGTNGLNVCKTIKSEAPEWAKVIVTSKLYKSSSMERDATRKYKADAYLEKPFSMGALYKQVCRLIGEPKLEIKQKAKTRTVLLQNNIIPPDEEKSESPEDKVIVVDVDVDNHKPEEEQIKEKQEKKPIVTKEEPKAEKATSEVKNKGPIDSRNLFPLLHSLFSTHFNGVLILEYKEGIKHVFMVDGVPVFVQSNIRTESLGQILISLGHLTNEQFQTALEEAASTKQKFGAICVRKGFITSKKLHEILTAQTAIKVANCFSWGKGKYKLDKEKQYPPNAPIFEATPTNIAMLASKNYVPEDDVEEDFEANKDKIVHAGMESVYQDLENELDEDQKKFVELADGKLTLSEIFSKTNIDPATGKRLAWALVAMGVFKLGTVARDKELDAYKPDSALENSKTLVIEKMSNEVNEFYMRLETDDHFTLMDLDRNSNMEMLTRSYKRLKGKFNLQFVLPDAPKALKKKVDTINQHIQLAFETLSNPKKREAYINKLDHKKKRAPIATTESGTDAISVQDPQATIRAELSAQRGMRAMEQQKYFSAVDQFTTACRLDPNVGEYHVQLGYAIFKMISTTPFSIEQAVDEINKGLSISPEQINAYHKLVQIAKHQGDDKKALKYLKVIVEKDPYDDEAIFEVHQLETKLKQGKG